MEKTKNVITLYTEEGEGKGKYLSIEELKELIGFKTLKFGRFNEVENETLTDFCSFLGITEAEGEALASGEYEYIIPVSDVKLTKVYSTKNQQIYGIMYPINDTESPELTGMQVSITRSDDEYSLKYVII